MEPRKIGATRKIFTSFDCHAAKNQIMFQHGMLEFYWFEIFSHITIKLSNADLTLLQMLSVVHACTYQNLIGLICEHFSVRFH